MLNKGIVLSFIFFGLVFIGIARPKKIPVPKPYTMTNVMIKPRVEIKGHVWVNRISAYNPVPRQTDSTPNISACGPNKPNQIAVSRDLLHRVLPCGTVVTLVTVRGEVFENLIVWDTMNPRYTRTADFMVNNHNEDDAWNFGVTSGYLITEGT